MTERTVLPAWLFTAAAVVASTAVASVWSARIAMGVFGGGLWNLASLWCLVKMLDAWLGPHPSRRRAMTWLLVKFPLLYLLVFGLLRSPAISVVGFGIGFSLVLLALVGWFTVQARSMVPTRSHGR